MRSKGERGTEREEEKARKRAEQRKKKRTKRAGSKSFSGPRSPLFFSMRLPFHPFRIILLDVHTHIRRIFTQLGNFRIRVHSREERKKISVLNLVINNGGIGETGS